MKLYRNIIFAGTFGRLHIGHKKMLERAFSVAEKVSIEQGHAKIALFKPYREV